MADANRELLDLESEHSFTFKQRLGHTAVKFTAFGLGIGIPVAAAVGGVLWMKGDDFASAGAGRLEPSVQATGQELNDSISQQATELDDKVDTALVTVEEARADVAEIREALDGFLYQLGFEINDEGEVVPAAG